MHASERFALGHALIHRDGFDDVVEQVLSLAARPAPSLVVTPNADQVVNLEHDAGLRAAYARADLVVADGMPVVWAAALLGTPVKGRVTGAVGAPGLRGTPVKGRVTGADLMPRLCEVAAQRGLKVFLLGGGPGVAARAADNLVRAHPQLQVAGVHCPPLGFEKDDAQNAALVEAIRASDADLVFVCLGSPKQEVWIHRHLALFGKGVFLGVGAAVDFCAGTVKRAPLWMQRSGLEWLYRLAREPRRLVGRYTRDLYFFVLVARELARRRSHAQATR